MCIAWGWPPLHCHRTRSGGEEKASARNRIGRRRYSGATVQTSPAVLGDTDASGHAQYLLRSSDQIQTSSKAFAAKSALVPL
jgi:FPC/CPF motif-containing protein YcgG